MNNWNIMTLLTKAQRSDKETYAEAEPSKMNKYRGGNAGVVLNHEGVLTPSGACPRLIYLRTKMGWQPEEESQIAGTSAGTFSPKHLMFDGGYSNEDVWEKRLRKVMPETHVLKSEEELDLMDVTLPSGLPFSGRPDQAICRKSDGFPEHVLEHKGVHSIWTARDVLFQRKPKFAHIIQLSTYMWLLQRKHGAESGERVGGEIIYSSYVNYVTNSMVERLLPRFGERDSSFVSYKFYRVRLTNRSKKGWTKDKIEEAEFLARQGETISVGGKRIPAVMADANYVKPFVTAFDVRVCHDGLIEWKPKDEEEWRRLGVGTRNIEELYLMAHGMDGRTKLPPVPVNLDANLQKQPWGACDYCPLKNICGNKTHKNVAEWKSDIKKEFNVDKFPGEK